MIKEQTLAIKKQKRNNRDNFFTATNDVEYVFAGQWHLATWRKKSWKISQCFWSWHQGPVEIRRS